MPAGRGGREEDMSCNHLICQHVCNSYCTATTHATIIAAAPWVQNVSLGAVQRACDRWPCRQRFTLQALRPIAEVGALRPPLLPGVPEHEHRYFLCHYTEKE